MGSVCSKASPELSASASADRVVRSREIPGGIVAGSVASTALASVTSCGARDAVRAPDS